jgi:hypothetical protein
MRLMLSGNPLLLLLLLEPLAFFVAAACDAVNKFVLIHSVIRKRIVHGCDGGVIKM